MNKEKELNLIHENRMQELAYARKTELLLLRKQYELQRFGAIPMPPQEEEDYEEEDEEDEDPIKKSKKKYGGKPK